MFVEPALLNKNMWEEHVLPEMAFRMGLDMSRISGATTKELHEILKAIPSAPQIDQDTWQSIQNYYLSLAPDSLTLPRFRPQILTQFTASTVTLPGLGVDNTTLRSDAVTKDLFIGTRGGRLIVLSQLIKTDFFSLPGPPSDIVFDEDKLFITSMGIMDPNDQSEGSIVKLTLPGKKIEIVVDSIKRPVAMVYTDLNNDNQEDFLVSAFGNFTGGLYAYEQTDTSFQEHVIHNFPGNRKAIVRDFNDDGLPDIMTLIAQGDEKIALFTNRGNFQFSYQVLLKFPPVYGSSYFELADFNADGHPDILYTNGDNADYSMILKPYHAIRIFLNDGHNKFSESWHHPMHGASMAKAVDFDADGDLDIAAISFFPDFAHHPEHSFIYFENLNGKFVPYATMMAAKGRWITMESADIDQDGDQDIVLAALNFPTAVPQDLLDKWNEDKVSLLVLKNNHKGQQ